MPRRRGCCESLGVHDLALVSPSSSLFFAQEILYKPIREWILLINLEGLVPTNTSTGLHCCFRPPGAVLIDCGQAVSHYIDRHAHLSASGILQQAKYTLLFFLTYNVFCNQIMALPLSMTPCMCVSPYQHILLQKYCAKSALLQ